MPKHWKSPPSTVTPWRDHSVCGAATFPSIYTLHQCRRRLGAWYSLYEGEPYHHTQMHDFQGAVLVYRSQLLKRSLFLTSLFALLIEMLHLILWHLFCSLISLLFVFSFLFCCYLMWENVPCAQLLLCSSRFHLTCILAAAFQLSYSGHNLNLCLQHHCQISYPFLKI